jgi:hypothetical protein
MRKENKSGVDKVVRSMLEIAKDRPQWQMEFSKYTEMYYESKMKPAFDTLWEFCSQTGMNPKKRINYVKNFQMQELMKEPAELRTSIRTVCDDEFNWALAEWNAHTAWKGSAEDYQA